MKLNLGDFKKIKSDKDSTTLRHAKGHEIKISHSALSPKMREQLHSLPMAEGGPVAEASPKPDKGPSVGSKQDRAAVSKGVEESGDMSHALDNIKQGLGFADGGDVKPYGNAVPENAGEEKIRVPEGGKPLPARSTGMRSGAPDWSTYGSNGGSGGKGDLSAKSPGDDEQMKAEGGAVRKYAGGGVSSIAEGSSDTPEKIASDAAASQPQPQSPQAPVTINIGAPQAGQAPAPAQQQQPEPSALAQAGHMVGQGVQYSPLGGGMLNLAGKAIPAVAKGIGEATSGLSAGLANAPVPSAAPQAPQAQPGPVGAPANTPEAAQPNAMDQYGNMVGKGLNEQIAGIQGEAQAQGQLGKNLAGVNDTYANAQQQMMETYQRHVADITGHINDLQKAIENQQIDPTRYIRNMGTGQKILTGLGILLGGSSSSSGGTNPALEYLNQNVNRDIDAQKAELGKKENLLGANLKQYGNLHEATQMTNLQLKTIFEAQAQKQANMMTDPIARNKALQAVGMLHRENAMLVSQIGAQKALGGASNNPDQYISMMRVIAPERAKELESRYVPGVGFSQVPLSEDARKQAIAMQDFHNQMSNLIGWAQKHSGETKMTNPSDVNAGKAMAQAAQNAYRTAQQMGVYKASEAPLLEGEIPQDPTAFFNKFRVLPQYKAVLDNNARKMQTFGKAYGLNGFGKGAASSGASGQDYRPGSFRPIGK